MRPASFVGHGWSNSMNLVIQRWRDVELSPYTKNQSWELPQVPMSQSQASSFHDSNDDNVPLLRWIAVISETAKSGIAQLVLLVFSACWLSLHLARRRKAVAEFSPKTPSIRWPYEAVSQTCRIVATAFLAAAHIRGHGSLINVVAVAYLSILGLLRLINDAQWRPVALRQVNLCVIGMLLVLAAAEFLPCIQVGAQCAWDLSVVGGFSSLAAAAFVAAVTPHEWAPPSFEYEIPGYTVDPEPSLEESCSWANYYLTYEWLTPMIWKGTRGTLDIFGIPKIAWYDEPLYLLRKVQIARSWAGSTLWTVLRYQSSELALMSFWISLTFVADNIPAYALYKLLDYLANPYGAVYTPWLWLFLMFAGPMSHSVIFQQYIFTSTRLIVRVAAGFNQELFHRALDSMELEDDPFEQNRGGEGQKQPKDSKESKTKTTAAGRLANLMAADVDAISRARDVVMVAFGMPVGTSVALIGLYRMLGWPAFVGFAILVASTPISIWTSKLIYNTQRKVRTAQDARISLVAEYLAAIRPIKYFAWEPAITDKIVAARAKEQLGLWKVTLLQVFVNQVNQMVPCIALVVMLTLHVGLGSGRLDASTAFTTVFLVNNLRGNIMRASYLARQVASAFVAFSRLDKYFQSTTPLTKPPVGPLRIDKAYFRRTKKATFRLEDISLDFVEGGLNVIGGQSGSGKSTLLLAILGETHIEGGTLTVPEDIAFASQTAWLQNQSIKDNILFGSPMETVRYQRVLKACCLTVDLNELPERDETVVGENGTSLSGGQRARVALARALYCKAPLLLLDDVFSALDAKTAAGVWKHCFCSDLLKGRTTVLVTQVPWIPPQADMSIVLDQGRVVRAEANISAVRKPIAIAEVLGGDVDEDDTEVETPPGMETPLSVESGKKVVDNVQKNLVNQEMQASGKVGRFTFLKYMKYYGSIFFVLACIGSIVLADGFSLSVDYWLAIWVEAYNKKAHVDITFYLVIFFLFNLAEMTSFGFLFLLNEWGAWRAAKKLHNDFIRSIMSVPLSWFKVVPVGRVTNRFSKDMASIDGNISMVLLFTLEGFIALLFKIGAVGSIMPVFVLPALFACLLGVAIGEMYTKTVVVIRRLSSSSQSPVFSLFADTLAGLPVIRARAGKSQAFREDLAEKLRIWSAVSQSNYNCNRWVAVRIDFLTSLVSLLAGMIAVSKAGVVAAGLVGFSLTSANALNNLILMLVRNSNELEVEMQSFHRVSEYVTLDPEDKHDEPFAEAGEYADDESQVIPKSWPRSGEVEFRNVTIRYDEDGPNILTDVNLKFRAGERVAVVGRTGSGKSTLILSLLRFTHVVSGQILYDGIDITKLPRRRLREALTIIPQEPVLFSGTVGSNLDPTDKIPTAILEEALDNCRGIASFSAEVVDQTDGEVVDHGQGLSLATEVNSRGENFSHGQRQVLSLCRALIRKNKILLLDEATASMDYETDRGIQQTLRAELEGEGGGRTLVTIAHRLRTIIDYDSIVVMAAGRVVESGSPRELFKAEGQFYDMVKHSGELEDLKSFLD